MRLEFEWDSNKERSNEVKHGISFDVAISAFNDRSLVQWLDEDIHHEDRWKLLGMTRRGILLVIYVERPGYTSEEEATDQLVVRIISARRANKNEQRLYQASAR